MTKKLAFNPLSGLFWCWPWVRAILPCGCEMANPFAPRSPITMTSQCCAGQDRKDFLSTAIDFREYILLRIIRARQFVRQICESRSLTKLRETRVIHHGIVQPDTERICGYRADAINRRLVMFYFATRVNVAAVLITNQVCSVMRKKRVFCHICNTSQLRSNMQDINSFCLSRCTYLFTLYKQ